METDLRKSKYDDRLCKNKYNGSLHKGKYNKSLENCKKRTIKKVLYKENYDKRSAKRKL